VRAGEPLLRARGVARRFGSYVALEPTDLEVRAGETLALVGPNGAGKSTLLSILAGGLEATAGSVDRADGVRVGWAPQRPAQYARLSPRENLELFARLEGERDPSGAAERLLAALDVPDDGRQSGALSVGNRQRLNLAIALLGDPRVLLLDEPTAALDPRHRRQVWDRIREVAAAGGAVVFATQHPEELERLAERVAVLDEGRIVFAGPVDELDAADVGALLA
jgi:ABC-2 type transport system ATP-binding protein